MNGFSRRPMRSVYVTVTLALLLAGLSGLSGQPAWADGPADNLAENVRPVPQVGVEVPADVRAKLEAGLTELSALLAELGKKTDPKTTGLLPDVVIFHKAVAGALQYNEFFDVKEFPVAEKLLGQGIERAKSLLAGDAPWTKQTGPIARGYVSKIDGSVQPYGLVVPDTASFNGARRNRLDVWLHGRGEKLSELNLIHGAQSSKGQFAPADTFVLHPYGRYCNAFKMAGEVDVLEGMDSVKSRYKIDENRIAMRGFSMGGAGCWQMAVHYTDLFAGNTPGAGFSETPDFLKVFQKETLSPTWYEQKLWAWYDCPGYAANLSHLPTIAYSGADDIQIQAARMMEAGYEHEGMQLLHLIGPKTGHSYHPETKLELEARLDSIMAQGRDPNPRRVHLTTYSLKYNQMYWAKIDALDQHWDRAQLDAAIIGDELIGVITENVAAFTLKIPSGRAAFDPTKPVVLAVDGLNLEGPKMWSDRSFEVSAHKVDGKWVLGALPAEGLQKRHDLQGPIDDAFMDSFLIVKPTGKSAHPAIEAWVQQEMTRAIKEWRRHFRGEPRVKNDVDVTEDDLAKHHVVVWGDPTSNQLLAKLAGQLPITWNAQSLSIGGTDYAAAEHVPLCIYPNPLNPQKYVVLNSGFTYREYDYLNNARQVAKLPDWAIVDVKTPPNARYPGKVVAADFFDERWSVRAKRD